MFAKWDVGWKHFSIPCCQNMLRMLITIRIVNYGNAGKKTSSRSSKVHEVWNRTSLRLAFYVGTHHSVKFCCNDHFQTFLKQLPKLEGRKAFIKAYPWYRVGSKPAWSLKLRQHIFLSNVSKNATKTLIKVCSSSPKCGETNVFWKWLC